MNVSYSLLGKDREVAIYEIPGQHARYATLILSSLGNVCEQKMSAS